MTNFFSCLYFTRNILSSTKISYLLLLYLLFRLVQFSRPLFPPLRPFLLEQQPKSITTPPSLQLRPTRKNNCCRTTSADVTPHPGRTQRLNSVTWAGSWRNCRSATSRFGTLSVLSLSPKRNGWRCTKPSTPLRPFWYSTPSKLRWKKRRAQICPSCIYCWEMYK